MSEERPVYELLGTGEARICGTCRRCTPTKTVEHVGYCPVKKLLVFLADSARDCQKHSPGKRGEES